MDQQIANYIESNSVCSELLFPNWQEFLTLLFSCDGHISSIIWFEYVEISKQKDSLGSGGYKDLKNPDYMWAETAIFDDNLEKKSLSELVEHIQFTINKHHPHHLVPCFYGLE